MDKVGVGGERVKMYNLSSGEGPLFAQYASEMVEKIKALGPSPIRQARQAKAKADVAA